MGEGEEEEEKKGKEKKRKEKKRKEKKRKETETEKEKEKEKEKKEKRKKKRKKPKSRNTTNISTSTNRQKSHHKKTFKTISVCHLLFFSCCWVLSVFFHKNPHVSFPMRRDFDIPRKTSKNVIFDQRCKQHKF